MIVKPAGRAPARGCASSRRRSRPCRRAGPASRASPRRSRRRTSCRVGYRGQGGVRQDIPRPRVSSVRGRGARGSPRSRGRPAGAPVRARRARRPAGGRAPRPGTVRLARRARTSRPRSPGRRRRPRWPRTRPGARGRRTPRRPPARARSPPPAAASGGTPARGRGSRPRGRRRAAGARGRAGCRRARLGSSESSSRSTASHACDARSSESRRSRSAGWAATVSAWVTVQRSPRPSCSTRLMRNSGSSRPPKRDLAPPYPFCDRTHPSALGGIQMEDAVGLAVAEGAQHHGLGLELTGHTYTQSRMPDAKSSHRLHHRAVRLLPPGQVAAAVARDRLRGDQPRSQPRGARGARAQDGPDDVPADPDRRALDRRLPRARRWPTATGR